MPKTGKAKAKKQTSAPSWAVRRPKKEPTGLAHKPLPLDDPRWLPAEDIHKLLSQRSGDGRLAASDLNEALMSEAVHCMRRRRMRARKSRPAAVSKDEAAGLDPDSTTSEIGDGEPVSFAFWATHEFKFTMQNRLGLWRKGEKCAQLPEFAYYLWSPDVARRWPGLLKGHATPEGESEENRGKKRKFTPEQIFVLQLAYLDYKKSHPAALQKDAAAHLQKLAEDKFGFPKIDFHDTIIEQIIKPVDEAIKMGI
jgi:hypothetical protein